MTRLEQLTQQFWAAALLIRQSGGREDSRAIRALLNVSRFGPPALSARADQILKEIPFNGE